MDFLVMSLDHEDRLVATEVVEGWSSLVWSEKYEEDDTFELKTSEIEKTMNLLKQYTIVGLNVSKVIMIVETLLIKSTSDGPELTVKGRGLDAFLLTNRALFDNDPGILSPQKLFGSPKAVIASVIDRYIRNAYRDSERLTWINATSSYNPDLPYNGEHFRVKIGSLYEWVHTHLKKNDLGIRAQAPSYFGGPALIYIHDGYDRTASNGKNNQVTLSVSMGHIINPSYLWSVDGYKTVAYVESPIGFRTVGRRLGGAGKGLKRHILQVDASDLTDAGDDTVDGALEDRGRKELRKHNRSDIFDFEVSPDIPYEFYVDYDLGDSITVIGDYGVTQDMRVTEFLRSENFEGVVEYPTLSIMD